MGRPYRQHPMSQELPFQMMKWASSTFKQRLEGSVAYQRRWIRRHLKISATCQTLLLRPRQAFWVRNGFARWLDSFSSRDSSSPWSVQPSQFLAQELLGLAHRVNKRLLACKTQPLHPQQEYYRTATVLTPWLTLWCWKALWCLRWIRIHTSLPLQSQPEHRRPILKLYRARGFLKKSLQKYWRARRRLRGTMRGISNRSVVRGKQPGRFFSTLKVAHTGTRAQSMGTARLGHKLSRRRQGSWWSRIMSGSACVR